MTPPGRFLVLEGVEGAGKTTQLERLVRALRGRGLEVVHAREPGGTPVGEAVRGVLLHRDELEVPARTELLLMLSARAAFVRDFVRPALERGAWVVADRFEYSTFAYQGYGRGLPLEEVRVLNRFATEGLVPDLVLVLDVPASMGMARQRAEAGRGSDRIEREGEDFLSRVSMGYRDLVAGDPGAMLIDATGSPDEVHARILRAMEGRFFPERTGEDP